MCTVISQNAGNRTKFRLMTTLLPPWPAQKAVFAMHEVLTNQKEHVDHELIYWFINLMTTTL